MSNKNGLLPVLSVVLVIVAVGAVAWFLYATTGSVNSSPVVVSSTTPAVPTTPHASKSATATQPIQKPAAQNSLTTSELVIPQWGVQFQKPQTMEDLAYVVSGGPGTSITFSTQQLLNMDPNCSAASDPIGALTRIPHSTSNEGWKNIGQYDYVFIVKNQGSCSASSTVAGFAGQQQTDLQNAVDNTLESSTQ